MENSIKTLTQKRLCHKKILFFILLSNVTQALLGQGTQSIDSIQITEADSIHAGSHTFSDTKLQDVTKAEGRFRIYKR